MTVADIYKTDPVKGGPDGGVMRRLNMGTGIVGGVVSLVSSGLVVTVTGSLSGDTFPPKSEARTVKV